MLEFVTKEIIYSKKVDAFISMLTSCTNQIEDYEKRNYGECMTCIGFIGALFSVIGAILIIAASGKSTLLYTAIAFILMFIPVVITIFMYNFAMNCRRSAILRGYTQFLEERLNELLCEKSMLYHRALFREEIADFPVNLFGPFVLAVALLALFVVCACFSWSFSTNISSKRVLRGYIIFFFIVIIISCVCCIFYACALCRNNKAVKRAKNFCDKLYSDSLVTEDMKISGDASASQGKGNKKVRKFAKLSILRILKCVKKL